MRNIIFFIFVLILLFVIQSCNETTIKPLPEGAFAYTSYNSSGKLIAIGWLSFDSHDSSYIEGEWKINKVGNPWSIGPQIREDILIGSFIEGKLHIELNPNFVDNNLGLIVGLEGNIYSGKWFYSNFIGLTDQRRFVAVRR